MLRASGSVIGIGALAVCLVASPATAQIPDTFMNLQVLPKDVARRDLVRTMREFTAALGVRCAHCHVGPDNLEGMDFATDAKDTKKAARSMLVMTRLLNADYVSKLPADAAGPRGEVTCQTCHRGAAKPPRPLDQTLADVAAKSGAEAAVARFQELRAASLDAGQYDFRERSVMAAANRLRDSGKATEALALVRQARALYPQSAAYHIFAGQFCLQAGDLTCADEALNRALELEPGNQAAQRALKALQEKKATVR
jgi:hypothetical protein